MTERLQTFCPIRSWRTVSGILLLAFVLRACIAVGYMPTYAAAQEKGFGITLCVTGLSVKAANALGLYHTDTHTSGAYVESCAFGAALGSLGLIFAALFLWAPLVPGVLAYRGLAVMGKAVPRLCGPPLGSRAPPSC
ncbi:MAG TPA: hypothetical protein VIP51_00275 [Eoetvoesiella sp.]